MSSLNAPLLLLLKHKSCVWVPSKAFQFQFPTFYSIVVEIHAWPLKFASEICGSCMPTFENGAEDVDVVEDGEEDEDAVEDGVELLGDEHRHRHAVPDEPRATDQDLQITRQ